MFKKIKQNFHITTALVTFGQLVLYVTLKDMWYPGEINAWKKMVDYVEK